MNHALLMKDTEEDSVTESWLCVDCGVNTSPGMPPGPMMRAELKNHKEVECSIGLDSEVYMVRKKVWKEAGMDAFSGCLCIGCLERRLGRRLKPKDFNQDHVFNQMPGTTRLLNRQGRD